MVSMIDRDIKKQSGSKIIKNIFKSEHDKPAYRSVLSLTDEQTFSFGAGINIEQMIMSADEMNIGCLSKPGYYFSPDEKAESIYETMKLDHGITEFTIIENDAAVGFMTRTALNETLGGRYGFTLFSGNPIREIMNTDFLRVNYDIPVEQASKLAMNRPFGQLYNPIVVEKEGKYFGIVTIKDLLDTCTKIAQTERDEISVMKDNLKIGLFFMNRNFIIQEHYSRYLEEMLSENNLSGKCFSDLLSASFNPKELKNIQDYFEMVFKHTFDQDMLEEINPLGEFNYINAKTGSRKVFQCALTAIEQVREEVFVLVTMYDITAKIELQQQLAEEESKRQEEMKSVFELIQVEPHVFDDFLEDAEYEFDRINEIFRNETASARTALVEIYQSVHSIKSNAVILGLDTFGGKVHKLESKIKKLCEQEEVPFDNMLALTMDIESLSMEKDRFKTIINKINSYKTSNSGQKQGQYILIESLAKAVSKVCEDTGKKIKFMVDGIDDEVMEKGQRRIIKETLIQLVRNSAVHGIETPEERIIQGKKETGIIRLSIKINGGNIHIKLGDDGCGIDYRKIAKKALQLNMIKPKDANNKKILLKVIFSSGFSTAENDGIHAGRGIGLSLVRDRVCNEKGFVKVQSKQGKGTVFNIFFPAGSEV
ncbi:MAG: CBS domain-containing protein [Treponema sp.]|jgi:two-component system chemotaxis sensor kinase CheA|nr:CBS domain-containing protein [Treponema sp.]